ncbi:hypothetical protein [Streptomyces chryseus]|uniref:Plasmid transfer protein TraB n=1 Tax=Streptomyces chryseus TaxID=68186 RepID=A0ABQ3DCW3_9ACTN|nr:hypothetical protein [Streptomyces chryseus]GHA83159.1 plasmid transfer protein TraB [Streptomyces chryseus]
MTALVPAGRLPANSEGAANSFTGVAAKLRQLQAAADALQEHAKLLQNRMSRNARAASALMDLCGAAGVAASHTGRIADVSSAFGRVAGGGARIASVTDSMGTAAGNVVTQHRTEYGGINAASTSSPVIQAKPGFYRAT